MAQRTEGNSRKNAADKELQVEKQKIFEVGNISACKHAVRNFTWEELGKGAKNAGGAKGEKNRWDVLERLPRINAGLSASQKNDRVSMLTEHGADWPELFAEWMQGVLEDTRCNAFSFFRAY